MTIPRIYCDLLLQTNSTVELPVPASHHLLAVLRMQLGEAIYIFNPQQGEFLAEIVTISRKSITVHLQKPVKRESESPVNIHLGQAISRGERMDFALQKAVELGVTTITPVISERCNVKLTTERMDKRVEHWQRIVISACEQCGRINIPVVHAPKKWTMWLSQEKGLGIICSLQTQQQPLPTQNPGQVKLLIGPEGGLSDEEVKQAINHYHCLALSLGPRVLRTETATIVALSLLQHRWGDISS